MRFYASFWDVEPGVNLQGSRVEAKKPDKTWSRFGLYLLME